MLKLYDAQCQHMEEYKTPKEILKALETRNLKDWIVLLPGEKGESPQPVRADYFAEAPEYYSITM